MGPVFRSPADSARHTYPPAPPPAVSAPSLDDTIGERLPSQPAAWHPVTLRRLLPHTSSDNIAVALMAEAATGRRYEDPLAELVYRPLGLRRTSLPLGHRLPRPFLHGYDATPPAAPEEVSEVAATTRDGARPLTFSVNTQTSEGNKPGRSPCSARSRRTSRARSWKAVTDAAGPLAEGRLSVAGARIEASSRKEGERS
ncbi:hypothetical protein ACFY7H_15130 [Streptomyces sp. NPDC012794]|uniref:hypothetical protein n=1 Tax=Streptomyces sp. NPDC012794 TaxID=3364850 RepID=UPI0036A27C2B